MSSFLENPATGGITRIHSDAPFSGCLIAMNESEPVAAFVALSLTANEGIDNFSSTDMARIGMILEIEAQTIFLISHNQAAFIQSPTNEWIAKRTFVDCDTAYRRCFTG
jgi:hypothetical protein